MKTRIITGIILAILSFLLIFYLHGKSFNIALALIFALASHEWMNMLGVQHKGYHMLYAGVFLLSVYLAMHYMTHTLYIGVLFWVLAFGSLFLSRDKIKKSLMLVPGLLMGLLLLVPSAVATMALHQISPEVLLYSIGVVAGSDVGAYFIGKFFGKRPLAKHISPKKTWEGLAGGLVGGVLIGITMSAFVNLPSKNHDWMIAGVSALLVIFGVVGDLFESQFKRVAGIKDSGKVLPGHGGLLDRLDSHFAAVVILAFILQNVTHH